MNYTRRQFADGLRAELARGYDPVRIGKWAYTQHLTRQSDFPPGLADIVLQVALMEEGEQFAFTEAELLQLVEELPATEP